MVYDHVSEGNVLLNNEAGLRLSRPDVEEPFWATHARSALHRLFGSRQVRRVLLVTPPDVDASLFSFETCRRGRYPNYTPYGLIVLATGLRQLGIDVSLVNLNMATLRAAQLCETPEAFDFDAAWQSALDAEIEAGSYDLIGVTCMFTQTHVSLRQVCDRLRSVCPGVPISIGGVHVTNAFASATTRNRFLEELGAVDLFFSYECDVAFPRFVEVVNGNRPVVDLRQVALRDGDEVIAVSDRVPPQPTDMVEIPAHDLSPPYELSKWGKVGSYSFLKPREAVVSTVLSNRGCRAQCTFCSVRNFNGVGVRRRPVGSVVDELEALRDQYGVSHIMWLDDDFLYDRNQSLALFEEMVRRNIGITWDCTNGVLAASCTDEVISAAVESGCIGLNIGMESGNPEILRQIKKPASVDTLLRAAEVLRRYPKIFTRVFLIIGFPHETFRQMLDTFEVSSQMGLDWHQIQVLQPLPNTPIFDQMIEEGLIDIEDFRNVRYSSGTYGRGAQMIHKGRDMQDRDFKHVFDLSDLDAEVPKGLYEHVWAFMNFHLNYYKILKEERPEKLRQFRLYLEHIVNVIAPNDALAHYFLGQLQRHSLGGASTDVTASLKRLVRESPVWEQRFADFGLSVADIDRQTTSPPHPQNTAR
jgi:radical SAM superfamily enzyme YgiQ (UPF0313 family)